MPQQGQCLPQGARILVIGAGIAGLSAAEHLIRHGFKKVTVLEATNRIGGRIHSANFGSNDCDIVEIGANWIHGGTSSNSMFNLANRLGLLPGKLIHLERMEGYCYRSDGRVIDKELTNKMFTLFTKWENEEPEFDSLDSRQRSDTYFRHRLEQSLCEFSPNELDDVRCVFNCLLNYCRFHNGGFLEYLPIPDVIGYNDYPGGNIKVPCGMEQVIHRLVQDFPANTIQLLKVVDLVKVHLREVQILCKDGTEYFADHVICTIPLGYLKKFADKMFSPPLPKSKLHAVEIIPFGKVDKIFLQWEKPFWKEGLGSIKLAWNDEEKTVNSPREWYKKIFGFDEVLNNRNVLVAWISGNEAEYMEGLSDNEILQTCAALIRHFLKDPSIPDPVRVMPTRWCTNPCTLGSYSSRNFVVRAHHITCLQEPLKQADVPRILFAGEATDIFGYSTMHGARDSGLREAERLIAHYENKAKNKL